jgi:predicted amidohydrolase YtcJ
MEGGMAGLFADTVITGGKVITVNPLNEIAEAVALREGKILAVGRTEDVTLLAGPHTERIRLNGQTVLPGFIEPHTHFMEYGIEMTWVNAKSPPNTKMAHILERLRDKAAKTPKGDWVLAFGIEEGGLEENRFPTKEEIDRVVPEHPVYMIHRSHHAAVANSRALSMAAIGESSPQPAGGHMDRDPATGRLTGVLREKAAFKPVQDIIPPPTKEEMKEGIARAGKLYATAGITSTHDAGPPTRPDAYRAYQEAVAEGLLKTRVYMMVRDWPYAHYALDRDLGLRTGFGNERLRIGPLKTCVDGSIQVFTCAFYDPYITLESDHTKSHPKGLLQMAPDQINPLVLEAHQKGYQVAIHAQGDYGIDVAIDAIEAAMTRHPRPDPRHRIEHCQCVTPQGIERMKRLGIIASFYPHHVWYWADRHVSTFIGRERANRIDPMKSAMDAGVIVIAHSDAPIATIGDPVFAADPLFGMWCAVNRKTRGGLLLGPEERLTPMEAIRAYTINAAYASFEETIKGSIEPGKLADLVILEKDPREVDPWEIRNIKVERTIIGGETVYQAS